MLDELAKIDEAYKKMREHADELYKLVPPDEGKKYNSRAAWHGHEVNKYSFRIGSALKKLRGDNHHA